VNFLDCDDQNVYKLLDQSPVTSCDLDPIPASLVKQCASVLVPTITKIINLSLSSGVFPEQLETVQSILFLKNQILIRKKVLLTIALSLTYLFCLYLLKE
jgi:hypothetical protein